MRQLLLLTLAAVMAAVVKLNQGDMSESIIWLGVEYTYFYESGPLTGIIIGSDQLPGVKVRSIVKLRINRDANSLLKLQNVKVYKINDCVTIPGYQLTLMTGELAEVMIEELMKPLKFRLVEDEVYDIQTESNDQYWSIDIKRRQFSLIRQSWNEWWGES